MRFNFEWDPEKARSNQQKHRVSFELAAGVFKDPRALSIFDVEHSGDENRWITLGMASTSAILAVNHTYAQVDEETVLIRLISSRKATKREQQQYLE